MAEQPAVRINKYLSEIGYCSRREADKLIDAGRITINGSVPELGTRVTPDDRIAVDGVMVQDPKNAAVYIAYNKPVGITCTTDQRIDGNIIDAIKYPSRIFPIGRLDKPSEGLIFLTNDGDIVNKILRARNHHEKEYLVTVNRPITKAFLRAMREGVPILDTVTRPCIVQKRGKFGFKIILTQGLNRQIRRMCEHLGYRVQTLKRVRIMNVVLDIPPGECRDLTTNEMSKLNTLLRASKKTHDRKD